MLARTLGRVGLSAGTDLEEVGRAYALLADKPARSSFLHTLRAVVDRQGQRVTALDRLEWTKRFPTLIVWGERDRIVPARHGRDVHQLIPNTYLAVFERAGHFPHRDEPGRFVEVVDEFLAREWRVHSRARPRGRAAIGA
jgi:pimeloyl-ACP methyl ester carboxylesterase